MNYLGSYKKLIENSKSAMVAAIEIYNKPTFKYRDECFIILLLNAWELAFKALLSKNGESIYYKKKRNEPYRTLSWTDALGKAESFFPTALPAHPVRKNLELLATYRDNAVHFYNARGFGVMIYVLAQTSVMNFRDLLNDALGVALEDEINWLLLPLGIRPPIDPIAYFSNLSGTPGKTNDAVRQYFSELAKAIKDVERLGSDTGRLLTVFSVKLESTKKIGTADIVVGLDSSNPTTGPLVISRLQDPNVSHPLGCKDIVSEIRQLHGKTFTSHAFQAIAWKHGLKEKQQYCWMSKAGGLTCYSNDTIAFIKRLTQADVDAALNDYREHHRSLSKKKASNG